MSVDVDALVQKITAEVTKQVLAAIGPQPDDDWPDWDEFNLIDSSDSGDSSDSVIAVDSPVEPPKPSSLRSRLNGVTEEIAEDEDDEVSQGVSTGDVAPIAVPFDNRRGGFDPRSNPSWFEVQYQREVVLPSRVAPR